MAFVTYYKLKMCTSDREEKMKWGCVGKPRPLLEVTQQACVNLSADWLEDQRIAGIDHPWRISIRSANTCHHDWCMPSRLCGTLSTSSNQRQCIRNCWKFMKSILISDIAVSLGVSYRLHHVEFNVHGSTLNHHLTSRLFP